jgi:8-amino-7-oxononanoate synthase
MIDFTSSLYLGFRHPSDALEPWSSLTTGKPAVLGAPALSATVAKNLAALQGCDGATLLPSTLHLYLDLFEMLRHESIRIFVDAGAYPIARWAIERAAAFGVPVHRLPHFNAGAARNAIATSGALRPVIVADGFCPSCGRFAPLESYLGTIVPRRGCVILDDTQALGIWGRGGGGSLRRRGVRSPHVILGSSLAKAFGAPLAALSGSLTLIQRFEQQSKTRIHSSPPSLAVLHAANRALALNALHGDARRQRLASLVSHFQEGIESPGLRPPRTLFPVQELALDHPLRLHRRLAAQGISTAVVRGCGGGDKLVFVIRAEHRRADIDRALSALRREGRSDQRGGYAPGPSDRNGSPGRIRTSDPAVNSRLLYH